jgi:membrane protease YdiL (CAAX protease family)
MRRFADQHPVLTFLLLAYAIAWILWLPGLLISHGHLLSFGGIGIYSPAVAGMILSFQGTRRSGSSVRPRLILFIVTISIAAVVAVLGMNRRAQPLLSPQIVVVALLTSAIAAWIVSGADSRDRGVRDYLRTLVHPDRWIWPFIAVVSFALYLALPAALMHVLGRPVLSTQSNQGSALWPWLPIVFAYTFFFGGGVSEEPGWRGFMLAKLQLKHSPLVASLAVWVAWALWHAPIDYSDWVGRSISGYLQIRVLKLLPLTILMTWLYNRSHKAILTTALFHTAFNTLPDYLSSASWQLWVLYGWTATVVITDRMWAAPSVCEPIRSMWFRMND